MNEPQGADSFVLSWCRFCNAKPGEMHLEGCYIERCPVCGQYLVSCDCDEIVYERIPWAGVSPEAQASHELDLWCFWGPQWIPCERDHPGAVEDLSRVTEVAYWDATARKYVRKPNTEDSAGGMIGRTAPGLERSIPQGAEEQPDQIKHEDKSHE